MLEHWLEEGRAAIVRRGSEIHRGKRKVELFHANDFLPVFIRKPSAPVVTHDDEDDELIFEQNDDNDDDIERFIITDDLNTNGENGCLDSDEDKDGDYL